MITPIKSSLSAAYLIDLETGFSKKLGEIKTISITPDKTEEFPLLPTTLFCEECGITETSPSFGQRYCRYCGAIFKDKSWFYGKGDEDE